MDVLANLFFWSFFAEGDGVTMVSLETARRSFLSFKDNGKSFRWFDSLEDSTYDRVELFVTLVGVTLASSWSVGVVMNCFRTST